MNSTPRQLASALPADIKVIGYSWPRALSGWYDVVHVHWPDVLAGGRASAVRSLGVYLLLALTRLRKIPRIWTVHNLEPHETSSGIVKRAIEAFQNGADARVYMYEVAKPADAGPLDTVIRRGLQVMPADPAERGSREPLGLLIFGLIRPYKGIESLIAAYRDLPQETRPPLVVCGKPAVQEYADEIRALADGVAGIELDFRWLSEEDLAERIRSARLAVLPYRQIYNSGVVLNALVLGCPALVSDSPTMRELRDEVGSDWVMTFDTLTSEVLVDALARAQRLADAPAPDLSLRDWGEIGARYGELYHRAFDAVRSTGNDGGRLLVR